MGHSRRCITRIIPLNHPYLPLLVTFQNLGQFKPPPSMQLKFPLAALWTLVATTTSLPIPDHAPIPSTNQKDATLVGSSQPTRSSLGWSPPIDSISIHKRTLQKLDFTTFVHPFMRSSFPNTPYSWILRLRLISLIVPTQPAAESLSLFYDRMIEQVYRELNGRYNAIAWQFGDITLEMRSRDPHSNIPFVMVYNLLLELRELAGRAVAGTYEGEVVSATTSWSIWIQLKIAGA